MSQAVPLPRNRPAAALAVALVAAPIVALLWLKWPSALAVLGKVRATGMFEPRPDVIPSDGLAPWLRPFARTASYLWTVRWALVWGLCISAGVRAFVQPAWLARLFGGSAPASHLAGGAAGVPLMLCSCCVAPVAVTVYQRSGSLAASLGLLVSAPSLNPVALLLTFLLFPADVAWARAGMALALVVGGTAVATRLSGTPRPCAIAPASPRPASAAGALRRFVRSLGDVSLRTLPLIAAGVLVSTLVLDSVDLSALSGAGAGVAVLIVAAIAVPIALPTFFEIPLAMILWKAGAPGGAIAALLFAGPAVNLPSLFTLARATSARTAVAVAVTVFAIALLGGLIA